MDDLGDDLDAYPEGVYVVATGSPLSGYKLWGTFTTVRKAVEWIESQGPLLGWATVMEVQIPSQRCVDAGA